MIITINTDIQELTAFENQIAGRVVASLLPLFAQLQLQVKIMSGSVDAAIANLTTQVEAETSVNASAITLINGFPAMIAAAVAAAQAAGATPAQLAAFDALGSSIQANADSLAAAVTTNTPTPVTPPAP